MRIVMPLFAFNYLDSKEFEFKGGKYVLRRFIADNETPPEIKRGVSEMDIYQMNQARWALVAENPDLGKGKEEINVLLLSFKICKQSPLFIKYYLCKENTNECKRLCETMHYITPPQNEFITYTDLEIINTRFSNLLEMSNISNRTHNAIYFMIRGFFSGKMIDTFMFLMAAIESLFSKEDSGGATRTICSRVSKFLGCKVRCEYKDIKNLYDLRSNIFHGRVEVEDEIKGHLTTLYELEHVLMECIKKILDEKTYAIYSDVAQKEKYFYDL